MRTKLSKFFYFVVAIPFLVGVHESYAKKISVEEAKAKASAFWGKNINTASKCRGIPTNTPESAYYVFNDEQDGFVIISGDDAVSTPVLGYSLTGHFDEKALPDGLRELLNDYERQISAMSAGSHSSIVTRTDDLFVGEKKIETAQWGQDSPYNNYCPIIFGYKAPTGCVATATAIVMRHYSYPNQGRGVNSYGLQYTGATLSADFSMSSYDWSSMPMENTYDGNDAGYNGVAKLMSDIGIAVEMQYSPGVSSASLVSARKALVENFVYSPKMHNISANDFSGEEWKDKLRNEIDNDRLIIYDGQSAEGGHAFVVDGYKDDLFSINWGWGGYCNGFFSLGNLQPNESVSAYNSYQSALIYIMPSDGTEELFSQLVLMKDSYGYSGFCSNLTDLRIGQWYQIYTGNIINPGKDTFNGELYAGLFDESGMLKEIISDGISIEDLRTNYYYNGISIYCKSSVEAVDGDYVALVSQMTGSDKYLLVGDEKMSVFKIPATKHIPATANVLLDYGEGVRVVPDNNWNLMYDSKPVIGSRFYFTVYKNNEKVKKIIVRHNGEMLYNISESTSCFIPRVVEDVNIKVRAYTESDLISELKVHVSEPGTLEEKLKDYDYDAIRSIIVSGNIDQRDFVFLNKYFTDIDMGDATVMAYDGYPANSIPANAFAYNSNLTRFIMPANITSISSNAFMRTSLTEVTIPKGVNKYGLNVFNYCTYLKEITVLNPEPAPINWCVLIGTKREQGGILHVPAGSKSAFEAAGEWNLFTNIVEDAEDIYTLVEKVCPVGKTNDFFVITGNNVTSTIGQELLVYDATGRFVTKGITLTLNNGLYIIVSGNRSEKILITTK